MNNKKPLVSIIIPTFNREALIGETLDSIIKQTYSNWECIVIDDGSLDNTVEVLKEYAEKETRIQFYTRPKNRAKGANACRNFGFEKSKGVYVQWFDSDDLMHPEKIAVKVQEINNSKYDFVVCEGIEYKDSISNVVREWNQIYSNNVLEDHITGKVNFHTNGPLFKRDFLEAKSLFDELLMRKQEWEFYSRLLTMSTNYKPIYKVLYYFRSHLNSMNGRNEISTLSSRIKSNQLVFSLIKKFFRKEKKEALRKHFFNKYVSYLKLAIKSKKKPLIYLAIKAILSHLTIKDFIRGLCVMLYKPKLIKNLFN